MTYALVTDGLVAKWDASSWTSGTTWTDDIAGKKITFSSAPTSSSDGLELTTSKTFYSESLSSLGVSYPCTFEWVGRIDGTWASSSPGHVFGLSASSGSWGGICCYSNSNSSKGLQFDVGSSGTVTTSLTTSGIEYHIVCVVTSSTATFYVNSTTAKGSTTKSNARANKYYIYNNEGSGRFSGAISRMCLWNKALTSDEISTLFTEAVDTKSVSLTIGSNSGGSVSPSGTISILETDDKIITITPNDGYDVQSITDNGTNVTSSLSYHSGQTTPTISLSTSHGTYSGSIDNIIDGDTSTSWWSNSAQSAGSYVLFTFSDSVKLNSVTVVNTYNSDYISSSTKVQISTDGSSWVDIGYFDGTSSSTVACSNTTRIKYIRFYAESASSKWLYIQEVTFDYSSQAENYYTYTVSKPSEDRTIYVTFYKNGTGVYMKINGIWSEVSKIYMKIGGSWTEVSGSGITKLVGSKIRLN